MQNAVSFDLGAPDFDERIAALDEIAPYAVHCTFGNRAGTAIESMTDRAADSGAQRTLSGADRVSQRGLSPA